jgi:hypothetical protein
VDPPVVVETLQRISRKNNDCIANNLQQRILSLNRKNNIIFKIKIRKYKNYYFLNRKTKKS